MKSAIYQLRQLEHHVDDTVRIYSNCETDDYPPHWHNAYEIILPMENQYTVIIQDIVYHIQPGEILVIPSGSVHELYAPETGWRYFFLVSQEEILAIDGFRQFQKAFYPCIHLTREQDAETLEKVLDYLCQVIQETMHPDALSRSTRRLVMGMIMVCLGRWAMKREENQLEQAYGHNAQLHSTYMDACMYISEHCTDTLTLDEIAERFGYSRYHFAREFKNYVGVGFYDYYMQQRIILCKQLLADVTVPVTQVALQSGFGSIATFNRVFKSSEGITPTQFRKMQQDPEAKNRNI